MFYLDLIQNVSLLVALAAGLQLLGRKLEDNPALYRQVAALLFGLVGIVGMMTPVRFAPGVIYDGRSIVLSLAGLFCGPAAALSALICGAYRLYLGGAGAPVGATVAVEATALGVALHYLRRRDERWIGALRLLAFGLLVHVIMLALQLLIPGIDNIEFLLRIGPGVLILFPLAFLLCAHFFLEGERRRATVKALRESEARYRSLFENNHAVMLLIDPDKGAIVDANPSACQFYGWSREQLRSMSITQINTLSAAEIAAEMHRARTSEIYHFHFRHRLADGGVRDVEVFSGPLLVQGRSLLYSIIHDITDRKRAEEAQRASEEFQRSIIACSPLAIFSLDLAGRILLWNSSAEKIFGWSGEEAIGKLLPIVPEDRQAEFARLRRRVAAGESLSEVELLRRRKDGRLIDCSLSAVPLRDGQGRVIAVVSVMQDITERKQAEQELQQKQAMLARTENIAHIGSWEWDIATGTVIWSDELFGIFQRDPARGAPSLAHLAELFIPEDAPRIREAMDSAVAGATPFELELRFLRADGATRHCLVHGYPQQGGEGSVNVLYGSLQDITELRIATERIAHLNNVLRAIRDVNQLIVRERSREKLIHEGCRLLVDNRGYAFALIILTDEHERPVSWAEAGMEKNFEPLSAMLEQGQLPSCCTPARPSENAVLIGERGEMCAPCPIAGVFDRNELLCVRLAHGGATFGYLMAAVEHGLGVDPEELGLFSEMAGDLAYALRGLQVDQAHEASVRRSETLERQLLQAQKMESVGRLAGGVAHDYNNMLSVIIGNAELSMFKVGADSPVRADLEEILNAAQRSAQITRQLLAFARKQTIDPKVLDLNVTLEGMLKMLRRLIGEDIDLAWRPEARLWPVKMDPAQLDQILANLCVNARDAIAGVGKVTIETHNQNLDQAYCADHAGFTPGDFVLLAVSDDGCGMEETTLDCIFEPFFTTKNRNEGTGLGLATVYGIVKQNNGFINVYSEPEKGTTFRIYLPRCDRNAEQASTRGLVEIPLSRGEVVLVVEDEPSILKIGKRILEELGYLVLTAGEPGEAMRLAGQHEGRIDLLITDVVMPTMNGRELADQLLAIHPETRILFMSGYTANVIAHRGVLDEGVNFLQKPFSREELATKVRAALDQSL